MSGTRKVGEADLVLGAAFGLEQVRQARDRALELGGNHLAEVSYMELSRAVQGWTLADTALCGRVAESQAVRCVERVRTRPPFGEPQVSRSQAERAPTDSDHSTYPAARPDVSPPIPTSGAFPAATADATHHAPSQARASR